jgi:hypothetical protein
LQLSKDCSVNLVHVESLLPIIGRSRQN